jgi:hypothetical protein
MIEEWYKITYDSLLGIWRGFLNFIPSLLAAIIVFVVGWFIAEVIGKIVARILRVLKLDQIFERARWKEALEAAEIKVKISDFIGEICKWVLVIVILQISVGILAQSIEGLKGFSGLLIDLIHWIPNLIVAVAIFVVAVIVADILNRLIKASVQKIGLRYGGFLSALVRWAIYVFAVVAILGQLKIEMANWIADILKIVVAGLVLAGALAFGLGGKEAAAKLIEDLKRKISE